MPAQAEKAQHFLELHHRDAPLLMPNAWDAGAAKLLASLGFDALATTSSGHAATLGRLDGSVTRDEALSHAATIVAATQLPADSRLVPLRAALLGYLDQKRLALDLLSDAARNNDPEKLEWGTEVSNKNNAKAEEIKALIRQVY